MPRLLPFALAVALAGMVASGATARQATPTAGCGGAPAPTVASVTVDEEIALELDRLFRCLAVHAWDVLDGVVAIPEGAVDPFAALLALDGSGLFTFGVTLASQMMRSTGPDGAIVDVAWRLAGQLRFERWTFQRRDTTTGHGPWSLTAVEAGVPRYGGAVVGITGAVEPDGVTLSRAELVNPGGIELRLDVASGVESGSLLVMFSLDACDRSGPTPLAAFAQATGPTVTIALDDPPDGDYALVLVPTLAPISRETICAAPTAELTVLS